MKRGFFIALVLGVGVTLALSQSSLWARPMGDAVDTLLMANQLYESGQFEKAAQAYQQLVDQGFEDVVLFYNLANAYFKQGQLGYAILNYRRAEQLAPRDADVANNLRLAREQTVDQIDKTSGRGFFDYLVQFTKAWLTVDELAWIALGLWFLLTLLLIVLTRSRVRSVWHEGAQYTLIVVALLLLASGFSLGSRLYIERVRPPAVVLASEVDVTSGPGTQYVTEFTLHSGAEVALIETRGNWVRLTLPGDELQGWVPTNAIARIGG